MMEHAIEDFPEEASSLFGEGVAHLFADDGRVFHGHDVHPDVENYLDTASTLAVSKT
jgi:hypothetical protein